jgi:hypothetical protein
MRWLLLCLTLFAHAQERAMLGVVMGEPKFAEIAGNYPDVHPLLGVVLESVVPESAAARAGLRTGDYLLALDERPISMQAEVFFYVATRKAGQRIRLRYYRPNAESGDGHGEREVELGGWRGGPMMHNWSPVEEFIQRMRLLAKARAEGWDGWERLLRNFDRDFSWLAAQGGLTGARRALECMHDVSIYLRGYETMLEQVEAESQWPEYALVAAVVHADHGAQEAAEKLAATIRPQLSEISEWRRNYLRLGLERLETPKRIRLMRSNPATRELYPLLAYIKDAAPPLRPGERAGPPLNCGWMAGFLELKEINSILWAMHTNVRYVPGFEQLNERLAREAGQPHMQDTVAWVCADNGQVERAIQIYKERVLPFTNEPEYSANLRRLEAQFAAQQDN